MKILSALGLVALTLGCAATAFAGGSAKNKPQRHSVSLLPGEDDSALPVADSALPLTDNPTVEVRRATAVMDPRDQTRLSTGSLWKEGVTNEAGMFADRRARRRGDVLTIIVSETVNLTNSITQQTAKTNSVSNPVLDSYLLNTPRNLGIFKRPVAAASTGGAAASSTTSTNPSVSGALGLTTSYNGTATYNNQQGLDSRATVTVTDVLPNGNLVIEGTRVITFSGETKYVELSGIVRQDDIAPENTVVSTSIADAKVIFHSEGSLTDAQKKGWLSRAFDHVNPL